MKELFVLCLTGAMLPDTVMQAVVCLYTDFYVYFSKFMPWFESHCKAEIHLQHPFQCHAWTKDTASYIK